MFNCLAGKNPEKAPKENRKRATVKQRTKVSTSSEMQQKPESVKQQNMLRKQRTSQQ